MLSIPFENEHGRYRLAAKYDLIAVPVVDTQGRLVVSLPLSKERETHTVRLKVDTREGNR